MSTFKKIAGLVIGVSAVGAIGVAVAQGVPPNPYISNPAIGAGEQTVHMTPIGETGVLAWGPAAEQTATITRESEQAAVAQPAPETQQPVASSSTTTDTQVAQAPQAPANDNSTQSLGAGPSTQDTTPAPRHDRG